ncbi:MAG: hypothetical protein DCC67_00960 [Planctomycetota bacterium]|nr:MAG: hypothetical protein DCC67_00960 [Planctomycetota bacterium]
MRKASLICLISWAALVTPRAEAANGVVWESAGSLVDTTNYTGLAPFYWFANFANPAAVTGAPMNQNEVRNLPSWLHLETNPALIGKDDSGLNADGTSRTGFSFNESGTVGATSTGGQASFNALTLPGGQSGVSGQAVDQISGTGTTTSMLSMRILSGAPAEFRMWVVTDNGLVGAGNNFQDQARLRVNLRNTAGPPAFGGDSDTAEAEALPSGVRIGQTAVGHNGVADAWAFRLRDVNEHDIVIVRPTSASGSFGAFAGLMIQPIPEPTGLAMFALAAAGAAAARRRCSRPA